MKRDVNHERRRLLDANQDKVPWRKWGPYLSERQWGTVREDYSDNGDAWSYLSHDHARSRAYHWGEDGLAGFSDDKQLLCFSLSLWNERDPILKERLFGLTNSEGNHGEDVKEYYFYQDNLPTHSYMRMLYKYPQAAFPYSDLVHTNRERGRLELEYELIDTHIFDDDRYFDVFVEYAKESPEEIFVRITVVNRGPDDAPIHVLPHFWFRNSWWRSSQTQRPGLQAAPVSSADVSTIVARHSELGTRYLFCEGSPQLLFTDNETNTEALVGQPNASPYVKDGINDYIVREIHGAVDPRQQGTKSAAHYDLMVPARGAKVIRLRFGASPEGSFLQFEPTFTARRHEADEFYRALAPCDASADCCLVMRQAFAGLLWSKQAYLYDVTTWINDRGAQPPQFLRAVRNRDWFHMVASDVISMPDKWEYPWFAAWDLAFHTIALSFVDPDFAASQLELLLRERYSHPNGQIPAYEWNFGDVNPPVHAWATLFLYRLQRLRQGERALQWLERSFHKLLLNFTWWVNRKDRTGRNVFEGGFLGLDNIGVFDRSAPLPAGGFLEEADGTAWMALFCQNMLEIALELAIHDRTYEELAIKFYEHFVWIAAAMDRVGDHSDEMWDDAEGFFYDVLRFPNGGGARLKVRSMVGLIPLCANTVFPEEVLSKLPRFVERVRWFNRERRDLLRNISQPEQAGVRGRRLLSVLDERKLRLILKRLLDPEEFLSDYGIRSLSRAHRDHPYVFRMGVDEYQVAYRPAESDSGMFGGNSNWRGPVWLPVNVLIVRALLHLYSYYGDSFRIECPTGSGHLCTLFEISSEISRRLASIFLRNGDGRRPVYGGTEKFHTDENWSDLILFYEYFHGDNGAGLGASHQTGWTALVGALLAMHGTLTPEDARRDLGCVFQHLAERGG
jgi:mannosylglycerate hydrolase MGH1-like protein